MTRKPLNVDRSAVTPSGTRTKAKAKSFYARALSQAEQVLLAEAREVEGLDEEIALLRVRLSQLVSQEPENLELLVKGVGMLVRAVSTRYRLSPRAEKDLYASVLGVLRGIGGALSLEGFDGKG